MAVLSKIVLVLVGCVLISCASAQAQVPPPYAPSLYVDATLGTDSPTCGAATGASACKTSSYVCNAISAGQAGNYAVYLADGTYDSCNVTHFHLVTMYGNATAPSNVVLQSPASGDTVFVQDHATAGLNNLTISPTGTGSGACVHSRQYAIVDLNNVFFGACGIDIWAAERSKINTIGRVVPVGHATYFAQVTEGSTFDCIAPVQIVAGVDFSAVLQIVGDSYANFKSCPFSVYGGSGTPVITGYRWINDHSQIDGSANLPGSGVFNGGHYEVNE